MVVIYNTQLKHTHTSTHTYTHAILSNLLGVRSAAVTTMPPLLNSALLYLQKNAVAGADRQFVRNLFHFMLPTMLEEIKEELDMEILSLCIEALSEVGERECVCVCVCLLLLFATNIFFTKCLTHIFLLPLYSHSALTLLARAA